MHPALKIAGTQNGYFDSDEVVIESVNRSGADILLVAMGVPLQEKWLAQSRSVGSASLFGSRGGSGLLVWTYSQGTTHSPQAAGEWMWRISMEPRRLWKRYLMDDMKFLMFLVKKRLTV